MGQHGGASHIGGFVENHHRPIAIIGVFILQSIEAQTAFADVAIGIGQNHFHLGLRVGKAQIHRIRLLGNG